MRNATFMERNEWAWWPVGTFSLAAAVLATVWGCEKISLLVCNEGPGYGKISQYESTPGLHVHVPFGEDVFVPYEKLTEAGKREVDLWIEGHSEANELRRLREDVLRASMRLDEAMR